MDKIVYLLIDELDGIPVFISDNRDSIEAYIENREDGDWSHFATVRVNTANFIEIAQFFKEEV